jgi:hypothetical protein
LQPAHSRKLSLDCEVFDGKYKTKEHTYFKKSPNSSSVVIDPGLQITLQLSAKTLFAKLTASFSSFFGKK